jgi:tetrapyrrole methylase family protein/MazG family protein
MSDRTPSTNDALFSDLVALMARLRSPEGCPWDREQDHRSLRHCLLEETYEVLEAIDRGDSEALRQELGDLLLQVLFHAQLGAEEGRFTMEDVLQGLHDKLVSRHPHVFGDKSLGDKSLETAEEVLSQWQALKHRERGEMGNDPIGDVPRSLPALSRAQVVQRRAARAGLGRSGEEVSASARAALAVLTREKLDPEQAQLALGEVLLAVVDLARSAGLDAEQVLRERVERRLQELG